MPRRNISPATPLDLLGALLVALVLLWPLPKMYKTHLPFAPEGEGAAHLWSWWAGIKMHSIFGTFPLIDHPAGGEIDLVDPLHAGLWWAAGGGSTGAHIVALWGLLLAGSGAWMLAGEAGAGAVGRRFAGVVTMTSPTLLGTVHDGITEGLGVGWSLWSVATFRWADRGKAQRAFGLAFVFGLAAWSGVYNAVWSALLCTGAFLFGARVRHPARLLGATLGGLLLATPMLASALRLEGDRPGSSGRGGVRLPPMQADWRGAWREGTDLLDLLLPNFGHSATVPATGYLGITLITASLLFFHRRAAGRSWMLAGGAVGLLALGPLLVVGGKPVLVGGELLTLPAALFESLPALERISRWYRLGVVAVALLAVGLSPHLRGRGLALTLGLLIWCDLRFFGPLPFPLPGNPMVAPGAFVQVGGPFAELPQHHPLLQPGRIADLNLLLQVQHGQATSATRNAMRPRAANALSTVQRGIQGPPAGAEGHLRSGMVQLKSLGFGALVLYSEELPPEALQRARVLLGNPDAMDDRVLIWSLRDR